MQSRAVCRQLERLLTEPGSLYHTALSIMLRISGKKKKSKLCKLLTNSFFEITCEECHSYFGPLHFSQCVINSSVTFHLYFMVTRKYLMTSQQVFQFPYARTHGINSVTKNTGGGRKIFSGYFREFLLSTHSAAEEGLAPCVELHADTIVLLLHPSQLCSGAGEVSLATESTQRCQRVNLLYSRSSHLQTDMTAALRFYSKKDADRNQHKSAQRARKLDQISRGITSFKLSI